MANLKNVTVYIIGLILVNIVIGRQPYKPIKNGTPYIVHFSSRYRALCVGTLVARKAVLTAGVCCINPYSNTPDIRSINVVVGSMYRHARRGIRIQVIRILHPTLPNETSSRSYIIQKSVALMILKRSIPDAFTEVPPRAIGVNYEIKKTDISLKQECFTAGYHFYYKGDKIYPTFKFLLQRNIRVQFLDVVKKQVWCEALAIKFQKFLEKMGYGGYYEAGAGICVKDPDRMAQPCHGMYGAPLICNGKMVGLLAAPDAQWTNCTGMSNIYHLLSSHFTYNFMKCVSKFFKPDIETVDMNKMKKAFDDKDDSDDYVPDLYDSIVSGTSSGES